MNVKAKTTKAIVTNILALGTQGSSGYPVAQLADGSLARKVGCFGQTIHDIPGSIRILDGKPQGLSVSLPKSLQCSFWYTWVSGLSTASVKLVPLSKSATEAAFTPVKGVTIGGKPVSAVESSAYNAVFKSAQKWPNQLAVLLPNGNVADGLVRHPKMAYHSHLELAGLPMPTAKPAAKVQKPAAKAAVKPAKVIKPAAKAIAPSVKPASVKKPAKKF